MDDQIEAVDNAHKPVQLNFLEHKRADRYCVHCNIQITCKKYNPAPNAPCTVDLGSDFDKGVTIQNVQNGVLDLVAETIIEARWLLLQNKSLNANNPMAIKNVDTIMKMLERIGKIGLFGALAEQAIKTPVPKEPEKPKSVFEIMLKK